MRQPEDYPQINAERLWQRHMQLAAIGATAGGGVHRLALSDEDIEAHRLIMSWADARGFATEVDDIGNMFIRRRGADPAAAPAASGSHTDTQPFGGRFDGAFGVLAAFEALEAFEDAGIETRRPVEAIIWNNEEGARFMPGLSGSAVYAGALGLEEMLAVTDGEGISMGSCVARLHEALGGAGRRALGQPFHGFVEAHIEQGTVLEDAGEQIGIVTDIQGNEFRICLLPEKTRQLPADLAVPSEYQDFHVMRISESVGADASLSDTAGSATGQSIPMSGSSQRMPASSSGL